MITAIQLAESRQFFEEVIARKCEEFFETVISVPVNDPNDQFESWGSYFRNMKEYSSEIVDENFDWTILDLVKFIIGSGVDESRMELGSILVGSSDYCDTDGPESDIRSLAGTTCIASVQIALIYRGIDPDRVNSFTNWRRSNEVSLEDRRDIFTRYVIKGQNCPDIKTKDVLTA